VENEVDRIGFGSGNCMKSLENTGAEVTITSKARARDMARLADGSRGDG